MSHTCLNHWHKVFLGWTSVLYNHHSDAKPRRIKAANRAAKDRLQAAADLSVMTTVVRNRFSRAIIGSKQRKHYIIIVQSKRQVWHSDPIYTWYWNVNCYPDKEKHMLMQSVNASWSDLPDHIWRHLDICVLISGSCKNLYIMLTSTHNITYIYIWLLLLLLFLDWPMYRYRQICCPIFADITTANYAENDV